MDWTVHGPGKIGDLDYRLDLPTRMRLHPTFYVGLLKPYSDPEQAALDPQSEGPITLGTTPGTGYLA